MGTLMKKISKRIVRLLSLAFILVTVVVMFFVTLPFSDITYADDEGGLSNLSLYNRSSELAREFGTSLAPGTKQDFTPMYENAVAGTAGGLLGYADVMSDDDAIVGWLTSSFTTASAKLSYDQLENITGSRDNNPFFDYAGYGEALKTMGLSKAVRGDSGAIARKFPTGYLMFHYILATSISVIISLALKVLMFLNPFKLFMGVFDAAAAADLGMLSAAARQVQYIYEAIQNISLYVLVPMLLVVTVFSVLIFRKGQGLKRFGRLAMRVFMIFAGLPLVGATYTGVIEDLEESISDGNTVADFLIYSSYVDFENWVKYSRLAPPENEEVGYINHPRRIENSDAVDSLYTPSRQFILYLNGFNAGLHGARSLYLEYQDDGLTGALGLSELEYVESDDVNFNETGFFKKRRPYNMLQRHFNNDKYSSSHYDGEVTGVAQKRLDGTFNGDTTLSDNDAQILRMFTLTASKHRTWEKSTDLRVTVDEEIDTDHKWWKKAISWSDSSQLLNPYADPDDEDPVFVFPNYTQHIYNAGTLRLDTLSDSRWVPPEEYVYVSDGTGSGRLEPLHDGVPRGGLSPLAMYNFLNTTFDDSGLTLWSSERSTSDQTRDTYVSVVHGSTGITAMLRWFETATLISSMNLLTLIFGIMMIQVAISAIPRILTGVFGTAFGSIASMTKLLISTGVILLQFLGMMFMYYLAENILIGVMIGLDSFTFGLGNYYSTIPLVVGSIGFSNEVSLVSGSVFYQVMSSIFMILVVAGVSFFMIKHIGTFKNMLEELVTDGIQRLMTGLDVGTGGSGQGLNFGGSGGGTSSVGKGLDADSRAKRPFGSGVIDGLKGAHELAASKEAQMEAAGASPEDIYGKGAGAKGIKGALARTKGRLRNRLGDGLGVGNSPSLAGDLIGKGVRDDITNLVSPFTGIKGKKFERAMDAGRRDIDYSNRAKKYGRDPNDTKKNDAENKMDVPNKLPEGELMYNANNELLDANGDVYTDENGNVLMRDENGHLVDGDGNYVRIGDDGVLVPSDDPVDIDSEARRLDDMRRNPVANDQMLNAQDNTHYGIDADGNVVNARNQPIQTKDGLAVSLDDEGRMIDENGDFVTSADLEEGDLDTNGYEVQTDDDGNEYIQHKGDEALRDGAMLNDDGETVTVTGADGEKYTVPKKDMGKSLTSLAREANDLDSRAERARERVERLKASGASGYAIAQAERQANRLTNLAKEAQGTYNSFVDAGLGRKNEPVTHDQVATAKRSVDTARNEYNKATQSVNAEKASLDEIKQRNKPVHDQRRTVANAQKAYQEAKSQVDTTRQAIEQAQKEQQDAFLAHTANPNAETKQRYDQAVAKTNTAKQAYNTARRTAKQTEQALNFSKQQLGQLEQSHQETLRAESLQQEKYNRAQRQQKQALKGLMAKQDSSKYANIAYNAGRSYGEVEQAHIAYDKAERDYEQAFNQYAQATRSGDKGRVKQARQRMNNLADRLYHASSNIERIEQRPQGTISQIDEASARVANLSHAYKNATGRERDHINHQLRRAERQLENLQKPKGWFGGESVQQQMVDNINKTASQARQYMKSKGIVSYSDFAKQLQNEQNVISEKRAELKRINDALSNTPMMANSERNRLMERRRNIRADIGRGNRILEDLRGHAIGMLDDRGFKPTISSKPINKHGGTVANQLSNLVGMYSMYDKYKKRQERGRLDDVGLMRLRELETHIDNTRRELVNLGIQEEHLANRVSIQNGVKDIQRAWVDYMNGKA